MKTKGAMKKKKSERTNFGGKKEVINLLQKGLQMVGNMMQLQIHGFKTEARKTTKMVTIMLLILLKVK